MRINYRFREEFTDEEFARLTDDEKEMVIDNTECRDWNAMRTRQREIKQQSLTGRYGWLMRGVGK